MQFSLMLITGNYPVWGTDVVIRVCQFHIVQAIQRWVEECNKNGSKTGSSKKKTKPRLSVSAMKDVLVAFRYLQRCRDTVEDPWETALKIFEGELRRICSSHGFKTAFSTVQSFAQNLAPTSGCPWAKHVMVHSTQTTGPKQHSRHSILFS